MSDLVSRLRHLSSLRATAQLRCAMKEAAYRIETLERELATAKSNAEFLAGRLERALERELAEMQHAITVEKMHSHLLNTIAHLPTFNAVAENREVAAVQALKDYWLEVAAKVCDEHATGKKAMTHYAALTYANSAQDCAAAIRGMK